MPGKASPLCLEYAGALHDLAARGGGREGIFLNDGDRRHFLALLGQVRARCNCAVRACCLMNRTITSRSSRRRMPIWRGMRRLDGASTQDSNRTQDRPGTSFRGATRRSVVEREAYAFRTGGLRGAQSGPGGARHRPAPRPLTESASRFVDRDRPIAAAYAKGEYTMKEIGEHFALQRSRVNRIVGLADRAAPDPPGARVKT
ncbi:hypothetical protein [Accumulibacter sp.]|uniref:hypothetical protein n=1 Tax=Accumulibacter sp. TaxID=2053492 RepID=UPI0025E2C219|nr:hypothetical protein [Accumulibacter sp.]MCM8594780.1 hypothetical protein [Accumulibacter sp.]MDS4048925.1 hypothetical protein [Accumulibacter sp.]